MLWRYGAPFLLCGLLGFVGQFLADTANPATHTVWIRSDLQSAFADDPHPFWLVFSSDGFGLATPYKTEDGALGYPGLKDIPSFHPAEKQRTKWQELMSVLIVLEWLRNRGDVAFRTAAIVALSSLGFVHLAKGKRRGRPRVVLPTTVG